LLENKVVRLGGLSYAVVLWQSRGVLVDELYVGQSGLDGKSAAGPESGASE